MKEVLTGSGFGSRADQGVLRELAAAVHAQWDREWPVMEAEAQAWGEDVKCVEGCCECCFTEKPCLVSEGLLITRFLSDSIPADQQERFRIRVESAASSLTRLRLAGVVGKSDEFNRAGGIECPFLVDRRCAIYPVRPLGCRSMFVAPPHSITECRTCPQAVACISPKLRVNQLSAQLHIGEHENGVAAESGGAPRTIPEVVSALWESGVDEPAPYRIQQESWTKRLQSRGTEFDQTWHDEGFDFSIVDRNLVLPEEEGEVAGGLIILRLEPEEAHDVYGKTIEFDLLGEIRVVYKLLPGGRFDWKKRTFAGSPNKASHIVFMGDSLQERLMMWEAAKRCRGRVLCGGLGMGIFPQYALSLPQVGSIDIVDIDAAVISLIDARWKRQPWPRCQDVTVIHSAFEEYARTTEETYDTIYIDTWDALTCEYLPHLNYMRDLSRRLLRPGGEILLWGYNLMLGAVMAQAAHMLAQRQYFLAANKSQLEIMARESPVFHQMVVWLLDHPTCSKRVFFTECYRMATEDARDLGALSLDRLESGQMAR